MNDLPTGWAIARLEEIAAINPRHPSDLKPNLPVTFVRMPALSETSPVFDSTETRPLGEVRMGYTHFAEGDVLFAKITPCMENGKAAVATGLTNGLGCGTTELHVLRPHGGIDPKYIFHFVHQVGFRREAARNFTGTAGQLRVPVSFIREAEIPLAPLPEQRRIVAKLEVVLGKVAGCQHRLAKLPVLLKRFHQSILAAACSGKLTADWREENAYPKIENAHIPDDAPDVPESWRWQELQHCMGDIEAGRSVRTEGRPPANDELGVLKISAVTWEQFDERESKTCIDKRDLVPAFLVKEGDFLITRANTIELVGACVIVQKVSKKLMLSDKTLRLKLAGIAPHWVLYWLRSSFGRREIENRATGNQQSMRNISQASICTIQIAEPPLAEQEEIVRRVEGLFGLADQLVARAATATAQVAQLTPSLLAKAFRGDLVPQDPNDEPAELLLQRISQSKIHQP